MQIVNHLNVLITAQTKRKFIFLMSFKSDGILNNPMCKTFKINEDEFVIQNCYYCDDCICFNIGCKHKGLYIYESGTYYSFDDVFSFDNRERLNSNKTIIQEKINTCKNGLLSKMKELLKNEKH